MIPSKLHSFANNNGVFPSPENLLIISEVFLSTIALVPMNAAEPPYIVLPLIVPFNPFPAKTL